jgi:hypothetical protein
MTRSEGLTRRDFAAAGLAAGMSTPAAATQAPPWRARRLVDHPIIAPGMDARMGADIEGPSLIRAPHWLPRRLGRYYLYFADHKGDYIRLAYADRLEGPWQVHSPGSLQLAQSGLPTSRLTAPPEAMAELERRGGANRAPAGALGIPSLLDDATLPHIASPDVHVDEPGRRIVMYFHGLAAFGVQNSRVAVSPDGLRFQPIGGVVGGPYMRVFRHAGAHYAVSMPGLFSRSPDGFQPFEPGPRLFAQDQRHTAVLKRGDRLDVFWTRVGDAPERIYVSTVDLRPDWMAWRAEPPIEVLRPERSWEGADLPVAPSYRSATFEPANQLRDPAIFEDRGRTFLLYAVRGEGGIGIAELTR